MGLAEWSQVCVLLPKNSFLHACTSFLGRAARNKIGFIVCKAHVVWFSCTDRGAGREQGRVRWLCGLRSVSRMALTSSHGFMEWQVLLGDRRSGSAVPEWMWLCSCGLTDFACCAIPHYLRPEWGGIFALCVTNSPSSSPCQETCGHLLESFTGISTNSVLLVPWDHMMLREVIKIMRVMFRNSGIQVAPMKERIPRNSASAFLIILLLQLCSALGCWNLRVLLMKHLVGFLMFWHWADSPACFACSFLKGFYLI